MNNNLSFLMSKNNIGVSELARKIKSSRSTIYRVLDGGNPSGELMLKLANFFDVDVKDIFCAQNVRHVVQKKKDKTA